MWKALDKDPSLRNELAALYDNNTFCKDAFTVRFPFWVRDALGDRLCKPNLRRGTPSNPFGATTEQDKASVLNNLVDWLEPTSTNDISKELWQRICTWAEQLKDSVPEVYEEISQKLIREAAILDKRLGHMSSSQPKFIGVSPPADEIGGWNDAPMTSSSGFTFEDDTEQPNAEEGEESAAPPPTKTATITASIAKPSAPSPASKNQILKAAPVLKKKAAAAADEKSS